MLTAIMGLWMATEALTRYEVLYLGSALPPASNPRIAR